MTTHVERYHIENCETIGLLCYRWGKRANNPTALRMHKLCMMQREHHMGKRLCANCQALLKDAIDKAKAELGLDTMSLAQLKQLAGETTSAD